MRTQNKKAPRAGAHPVAVERGMALSTVRRGGNLAMARENGGQGRGDKAPVYPPPPMLSCAFPLNSWAQR